MNSFSTLSRRSLAIVVLGALLSVLSGWAGKPHPAELSLHDLHGRQVRLKDLRGKIVVLNFWATWCGPCHDEMPMMVAFSRQYPASRVVFIGASVDGSRTRGKVPAFIERYHVTYPVWVGATAGDLHRLHMGDAVPATAFIDQNGEIVARVLGQMRPEELTQRLAWLLYQGSGSAPPALVVHLDRHEGK